MNNYQSQMTFLYYDDFERGKYFLEEVLLLEPVYTPDWAVVYRASEGAYIGAVDAKRGSVDSKVRGGFLVSLTVDDVVPHHKRLEGNPLISTLTPIKTFEDIGIKSFFFKGPEGYDFEIQQFASPEYDFTKGPISATDTSGLQSLDAAKDLIEAERLFNQAAAVDGARGWAKYFLVEGCMLTKSGDPIRGQEAIEQAMGQFFSLKHLVFTWEPSHAEVSKDKSLGYTYGRYHRRYQDREDQIVEEKGMYMSVWKRDASGNWRVAADIGN